MSRRSALVTGATRGIGFGIAHRLAELGFGLTIAGRDGISLRTAAARLCAVGSPDVIVSAGDLEDAEYVARLVDEHGEAFGSLDCLAINAGVGTAGDIASYSLRRFDKTFAVNVRAPFALVQRSLPLLRDAADRSPETGAKIVALASLAGAFAEPGLAAYGSSKAALINLVRAVNLESSGHGVTATAIAPGYVDTEMSEWVHDRVPAGSMIPVSDIVRVVEMLISLSPNAAIPEIVIGRAGTSGYAA